MSGSPKITTSHSKIRQWAEERNGTPACVKGTGGMGDTGVLRINFPGYAEEDLQDISWDEFFDKFEENDLAFVYQNRTAEGETSRFNKLIDRQYASGPGVWTTLGVGALSAAVVFGIAYAARRLSKMA